MSHHAIKNGLPDTPYPGIEPFSYAERGVFFAREAEARKLNRLIVLYRGVLLYSDSGTGKSSLVNAGLIPRAIQEGYQPERIRVQPLQDQEFIVERSSANVSGQPPFLPSIFALQEQQRHTVWSVEEFMDRLCQRAGSVLPLLIFDQFEEWITLFEEGAIGQSAEAVRATQDRIRNAICSIMNDKLLPSDTPPNKKLLPAKVLLVFREEYLPKLAPFFERCPSLPGQYLRLNPLQGDQIYRAIRGPFNEYEDRYRPELTPALAQKVQNEFEKRNGGANIRLTEVQIVCRSLFAAGQQGQEPEQYFIDKGGIKGILEEYLENALDSLESKQQDPAIGLLTRMVTSAGTRNVISQEDLLSRVEVEEGIPRELLTATLDSLEQETKLVRREMRREVFYYEIASEFLVEWIQKEAQKRQQRLAEEKAAREAVEQEQEAARQRTFKRLLGVVAVLIILVLGAALIALYAFLKRNEAEEVRQEALANYTKRTLKFQTFRS